MKTAKIKLPEIQIKYRNSNIPLELRPQITTSKDSETLFRQIWDLDTIELLESVKVVYLNRDNRLLGYQNLSNGGITCCIADVRLLFATALKSTATNIVLAHNHPSGNYKPSHQDEQLTKKVLEGCKHFDLKLLDHIILTRDGYYSFADNGDI